LHVAAESAHKNLTILLVKAGADVNATDYRGKTAEDVCNGPAQHAFYELRGLKYEAKERFVGKVDRQSMRQGQGVVYFKPEGYMQEEKQLYRGSFKNNLYHGHGTLYHIGSEHIAYIGR
jgi:ankyrin repeat protein